MSYSYYLLHGLALKAGFLALAVALPIANHGFLFSCALLPALFGLTLIPTAVLFLAVERPFSLAPHRAPTNSSGLDQDYATVRVDVQRTAHE